MRTEYPATPHGSVIFCDDVREEVGGKFTLVGVYNGIMYYMVPFPTFMPKLAMRVSYVETPGESTEAVEIKVLAISSGHEAQILFSHLLPAEARDNVTAPPKLDEDSRVFLTAMFNIIISPLLVPGPCKISVRAYRGDVELRLGSLRIMHHPDYVPPTVVEPTENQATG